MKAKREAAIAEASRRLESEKEKLPDITMDHPERGTFIRDNEEAIDGSDLDTPDEKHSESELRDTGGGFGAIYKH